MSIIKADHTKPFFLYLAFNAPHTLWQAPQETIDRLSHLDESQRTYYAMIKEMDQAIGNLLKSLKQTGQDQTTIVVFQSDNGRTSTLPAQSLLRGFKGNTYEGGIRVPGAIKWPGHITPGQKSEQVITVMDWLPTLASMAGLSPGMEGLDGEDLWPTLQAREVTHRKPIYITTFDFVEEAIISGKWKYIVNYTDNTKELLNMFEDPGETTNLAAEHPNKVDEMKAVLRQWQGNRSATTLKDYILDSENLPNFRDWVLFYQTMDAMEKAGELKGDLSTREGRTARLWEVRARVDELIAKNPDLIKN